MYKPALAPRRLAAVFLIVVTLIIASCAGKPSSPPNVIIIVMDTLRADHLGCYGYERPTSPSIDAFAAETDFFTRAYATAPWTMPSHASLFTGQLPFEHGAHTYKDKKGGSVEPPLSQDLVTLAEVFRQQGYQTGAFVANDGFLHPHFQFDQGFDRYHVERVYADQLFDRVLTWLRPRVNRPVFMWINTVDTHRVYNTTPRPGFLAEPAVQDQGELLDRLIEATLPGDQDAPPALRQQVVDQYDTAIANLDEQIGLFLQELKSIGIYDDTIIVLTSDHGEYLGEHRLVEHSKDVYEQTLHIPLMIKDAGQTDGARIERPASIADVPAHLFARLPEGFAADERATFTRDPLNDPLIAENHYTRSKDLADPRWGFRFRRVRTVLYTWPYKYIESSDGDHELYRLDLDPAESRNLVASEAERAEDMAEHLADFRDARASGRDDPEVKPLSEDQIKRLRSLGYIGD
jgi:arylsulfatase A-like enzyme